MILKDKITNGLETKTFGKKLFVYDSLDSTNTLAKSLAQEGAEEGTVVLANHQTGGRGRHGRTWQAEPGSNLLFSLIIHPAFDTEKIGLLPFYAAVGIVRSLETFTEKHCECKWPNDILLNDKKCCGILMESTFQRGKPDYVIIGIGLNVNQTRFPGVLERTATSLKNECHRSFDLNSVFCHLMSSLELLYLDVTQGDFQAVMTEWKDHASLFGKHIILNQAAQVIEGQAIALTADGGLILETGSTRRVVHAGDVTVLSQR